MKRALFLALLLSFTTTVFGQEAPVEVKPTPEQSTSCQSVGGEAIVRKGSVLCDLPWVDRDDNGKLTIGKIPDSFTVQKGHLYFQNGMVCKGCRLIVSKDMKFAIVVDRQGYQWPVDKLIAIDKHPFARAYAQAAAVSAQQYGAQMQQNAQRQMMMNQLNKPMNINCTSMPAGYSYTTNCNSY